MGPADLIFREENTQRRETIEQAGQDPLHGGDRSVTAHRTKAADLIDQIVGKFFRISSDSLGYLKSGPSRSAVRSRSTCTLIGMFNSRARAQKRSSSSEG